LADISRALLADAYRALLQGSFADVYGGLL